MIRTFILLLLLVANHVVVLLVVGFNIHSITGNRHHNLHRPFVRGGSGRPSITRLLALKLDYPVGFDGPDTSIYSRNSIIANAKPQSVRVTSCEDLKRRIRDGYRVSSLDVRGDTRPAIGDVSQHPVIQAIHSRIKSKSTPGNRTDGMKIGLAIEGGGMRGCVAAGMATVLYMFQFHCTFF
jgi:hypothetical protein